MSASSHEGDSDSLSSLEEEEVPVQPSAKALGKRKVVDFEVASGRKSIACNFLNTLYSAFFIVSEPADVFGRFRDSRLSYQSTNALGPDFEGDQDPRWRHPVQVQFVYDAVAERRRQLMLESRGPHAENQQRRINGVH